MNASGARFEHQVKRRLSGPAKAGEAIAGDYLADAPLARLCAQTEPYFLTA
jgi:hypothetical protein